MNFWSPASASWVCGITWVGLCLFMATLGLTEILNIRRRPCIKVLVSLRLLWEMVDPLASESSRSKLGLWTDTVAWYWYSRPLPSASWLPGGGWIYATTCSLPWCPGSWKTTTQWSQLTLDWVSEPWAEITFLPSIKVDLSKVFCHLDRKLICLIFTVKSERNKANRKGWVVNSGCTFRDNYLFAFSFCMCFLGPEERLLESGMSEHAF